MDGYARLNAVVNMPITGGEQYTTVEQFEPYLEERFPYIDGPWGVRIER